MKDRWVLTAGPLRMDFLPVQGGKVRSLRSLNSGRNFFLKDPGPVRAGSATRYLEHDISGWDECFPSVAHTSGPFGWDHGALWQVSWQTHRLGNRLLAWADRPRKMPVSVQRLFSSPESGCIRCDYTFLNTGRSPLPFIYSAHPILSPDPDSRVVLPGVRQLKVLGHNGVLQSGRQHPWPRVATPQGRVVSLDTHFHPERRLAGKWFASARGMAHVTFPRTCEQLELTWDAQQLPHLGLWLSLGIPLRPGKPKAKEWVCLALEPCTEAEDVLGKKAARLLPGRPYVFWIQWKLKRLDSVGGK